LNPHAVGSRINQLVILLILGPVLVRDRWKVLRGSLLTGMKCISVSYPKKIDNLLELDFRKIFSKARVPALNSDQDFNISTQSMEVIDLVVVHS